MWIGHSFSTDSCMAMCMMNTPQNEAEQLMCLVNAPHTDEIETMGMILGIKNTR